MIAAQPLDTLPRLSDADLHGAWLNRLTKGGKDHAPDSYDMARVGLPSDERVGMSFDGAADYLYRSEANWQAADGQGTISMWIKADALVNFQKLWSSSDQGTANYYLILSFDNLGHLAVQHKNNDTQDVVRMSSVVVVDRWYHVVLTSDGSAYSFYLDGVIETPVVTGGANTGDWLSDTPNRDNVVIGALRTSGVSSYFNGSIRDLRYYSRALTADEIAYQYKLGVPDDSLALHLHKHQDDLSRYAAEFDNINGAVLGHELEFDGSTNYLRRAVAGWRSADSVGTISAWVKFDSFIDEIIWSSSDEASDTRYLYLAIRAGRLTVIQNNDDAEVATVGGTPLFTGRWYHVVAVSDGSEYTLYVNGVAETLAIGPNDGDWLADTSARDNVCIGAGVRSAGVFNPFEGKIKDLRYHSEAKSADWVKTVYDKTKIFY